MGTTMEKSRAILISGREFLVSGAVLIAISYYLEVFGILTFGLGILLYTAGLYLWSVDADSRPLLLFLGEAILMAAGAIIIDWWIHRTVLSPIWGFGSIVFALLPGYPFFVATAVLYRVRTGIFAGETGEPGFNLAGNITLIGALLFPLIIGVPLFTVGRFIEIFYLWKMPEVETRVRGLPFVTPRKLGVISLSALLVGGLCYYAVVPDYDFSIINGAEKVALYGNFHTYTTELTLIYAPRTCGKVEYKRQPDGTFLFEDSRHPCNVRVYVDGKELYPNEYGIRATGGLFESLFGTDEIVVERLTFSVPKNSSTLAVLFEDENVTFQIQR
ncbi:hypothetical protein [Thermococcus stetteri]|uniref:hypothetical protein n=1 Tax=Thermococcus stetteri TaxID=49900 RepID=UPI001AE1582E|nr:hypothetical protein [Thermococcus stetteri]MBP1912676.1 putative membrane protein [Thermococcus stetteri]